MIDLSEALAQHHNSKWYQRATLLCSWSSRHRRGYLKFRPYISRITSGYQSLIPHYPTQTPTGKDPNHPIYDPTACAKTLPAKSAKSFALSACGSSWNTLYTLFPFASLTAPSLFPATAPAIAPGKFAMMNPMAPPLNPPSTLQNLVVGCACSPSAIPSSRSISSNTFPNCSLLKRSLSASVWLLPKPNADQGKEPKLKEDEEEAPALGRGISSSAGSGAEEKEELKPWKARALS